MPDMSMGTEHITDGNKFIVDGIITKGLNLLVAPKEEGSSFALGPCIICCRRQGIFEQENKTG